MKIFTKKVCHSRWTLQRQVSEQTTNEQIAIQMRVFRGYIRCIFSIYQCDCLFHDTLLNCALSTVLLNHNKQNMKI